MKDSETKNKFVELRAQGWSYDRIAKELKVGKGTLVDWGRQFEEQIQNLRTIEVEGLLEKHLASKEARVQALGLQLDKIEKELARRDLSTVPTARLIVLAAMLRREMNQEYEALRFRGPEEEIAPHEKTNGVREWKP